LHPDDRRALIQAAAGEVFAASGYDRASMRKIAAASGVTTPVLYDHFPSKAELYAGLVQAHADALLARWAGPEGVTSPEDLFERTLDAIFSWIEENEAGWRMLFVDAPTDAAVAAAQRRAQDRATAALIGLYAVIPQLDLSVDLDRTRADHLLAEAGKSAVNAIASWWWNNRDLPRRTIVLLARDMLWRGLRDLTTPS
jgi:AcrR family transcriptional regulator